MIALILAAVLNCGSERIDVKHLEDDAAKKINFKIITDDTVEHLASLPKPDKVGNSSPRGVGPEELAVYRVEACIATIKHKGKTEAVALDEADQDVHLGLRDPKGKATIIGESVDPQCADRLTVDPDRLTDFVLVRLALRKAIGGDVANAPLLQKLKGKRLRLTGVGFYDKLHGQDAHAPNGFELHPLLKVEVIGTCP